MSFVAGYKDDNDRVHYRVLDDEDLDRITDLIKKATPSGLKWTISRKKVDKAIGSILDYLKSQDNLNVCLHQN